MSAGPAAPVQPLASLLLQPDPGLAPRLELGQLIRGQVLRHTEGNRYLVRILGHVSVAESARPLRAGEVLFGRVSRLDERIELERIAPETAAPPDEAVLPGLAGGAAAEVVRDLFRRYRGSLEPQQADLLRRLVARASRPERMALAGLVLHKIGLPLQRELLDSVYGVLASGDEALAPVCNAALELELASATAQSSGTAALADRLSRTAPELEAWPVGQRVLNVQGGGSVAHQAGSLALRFGDEPIKARAAVFEEQGGEDGAGEAPLRHRKLVLEIETERLARIEARAVTAGEHLRVALAAASSEQADALSRHGEALARAFADDGWRVDKIAYETQAPSEIGAALDAVVEHLVLPGSVSRFL